MAVERLEGPVGASLRRLTTALGGTWALAEVAGETLGVVTPDPSLASRLGGCGWFAVLAAIAKTGTVIRLDDPSAGLDGPLPDRARFLVAEGVTADSIDEGSQALLMVITDLLEALAEASDKAAVDDYRAERLELRASTDPLTGLLNRRGWDRLVSVEEDRCQRHGLAAEVVVIDLDGLKNVNDKHGHEAGDALLVRAATYIFSAVRIHDAVARLGGDEFAVLAVGTEPGGETVAERIKGCLVEANIAASVGSSAREGGRSLAEAWRVADLRMYRAKQVRRRPASSPDAVPVGDVAEGAEITISLDEEPDSVRMGQITSRLD